MGERRRTMVVGRGGRYETLVCLVRSSFCGHGVGMRLCQKKNKYTYCVVVVVVVVVAGDWIIILCNFPISERRQ